MINTNLPVKLLMAALLFSIAASAQKLPKVQQASVRAPANIKIDGRTTEWNDRFQAYNPVSRVLYTISNDDHNLYLTARMDGERASVKALSGGVTLTIKQSTGQNSKSIDTKSVAITYPAVINSGSSLNSKERNVRETVTNSPSRYKNLKKDTANKKDIIALIALTNKQIVQVFKEIQVSGIEEITEPLISLYNTTGIKTALLFNDKMEYTYELAIPLIMIEASLGKMEKLSYNIKLNARPTISAKGVPGPPMFMGDDPELNYQSHPTDFWGEYTLAKK